MAASSWGCVAPYGIESLIRDRNGVGGALRTYRERFDGESWHALRSRVPLNRSHDPEKPLGWAVLENRPETGLYARINWIDGSRNADDAVAEVRSGVLSGLSIGFVSDEKSDVITRGPSGIPSVLRRGVELLEVSLVANPAHPGARVIAPDFDVWQHEQSEALMAPWRKRRAAKLVAQRRADAELLADIVRLGARDFTVEPAVTTELPTDLHVLEMRGLQYSVRDAGGPDAAAERLRRALDNAELFARSLRPEPDTLRKFLAVEGIEALTR